MKTISTPKPEHRCLLPGNFAGLPSSPFDQHYEPVGTVIECEDCGRRYRSEPWPDVRSGMQKVGNRWTEVYRLPWTRWKWNRLNQQKRMLPAGSNGVASPTGNGLPTPIVELTDVYSWGPVPHPPWKAASDDDD